MFGPFLPPAMKRDKSLCFGTASFQRLLFCRPLGPALRAKCLDGIRALVLVICLPTFPCHAAARAFMRVRARLAHKLPSTALSLLALAAEARPGHRFEAGFGDGIPTGRARSVGALSDPSERLFDRSRETPVSSMQLYL